MLRQRLGDGSGTGVWAGRVGSGKISKARKDMCSELFMRLFCWGPPEGLSSSGPSAPVREVGAFNRVFDWECQLERGE